MAKTAPVAARPQAAEGAPFAAGAWTVDPPVNRRRLPRRGAAFGELSAVAADL